MIHHLQLPGFVEIIASFLLRCVSGNVDHDGKYRHAGWDDGGDGIIVDGFRGVVYEREVLPGP